MLGSGRERTGQGGEEGAGEGRGGPTERGEEGGKKGYRGWGKRR